MNPLKNTLELMRQRVVSLHSLRAGGLDPSLEAFFKDCLANPGDAKEQAKYMEEASKDKEKMLALNALRIQQVNNYIRATSNFATLFFQEQSLGEADRPVIQNETKQEISIGFVGQDGAPKCVRAVAPTTETLIDLRFLMSEKFGYRLTDIYNGNVAPAAQKTVDIGFDLANKIDKECFDLMTASRANGGAFGNFTVTGSKISRDYVPNSRIDTSNLPTSNDLVLSTNTASTKFRLEVIREIMRYCDKWANVFSDGPLRPTGMIVVPSIDATDLAEEITPTGSTNNPVADGLLQNYTSFTYMGVRWTLIPDATLPAKTCYPVLNKPLGILYSKPNMDEEYVETDRPKNWEERYQRKVFGATIPGPWRLRALRIKYRS